MDYRALVQKLGDRTNQNSQTSELILEHRTGHPTIIMKRNLIEKLGGFKLKYRILADFDLINNAYYVGIKTRRCDNCIAIFQIGGLSTDNLSSLKERFDILTSYAVPKEKAFLHCLKMGILFCLYKIKHRYF